METLQIKKEDAIKAFDSATKNQKELLINLFGKKTFLKSVQERIKTMDDVYSELGVTSDEYSNIPFYVKAFIKVCQIAESLNEGWQPDWSNSNEYKYYPWFSNFVSGSGFACDDYGCNDSDTSIGSRLCFKTEELAQYAGKQFEKEYNEYLLIQK
jgi:hypothetical protein